MKIASHTLPLSDFRIPCLFLLSCLMLVPGSLPADEEAAPEEIELLDFEVWNRERGYWFGEYTLLNASGNANYKASDDPTSGQFNYRNYYGFINLQVKGSELKQRNIFIRPALELEGKDLNSDGTVSINELDQFGFTSPYDYQIDLATTTATPMQDGIEAGLLPFDYTEATEKTFTANQTATDNSGNLSGSYFGIPTTTTIIGNDTVLYRVGNETLYQNQLTTLPGNGTRVRTAQGFFNGTPVYASFYRETRFEDDVDENGIVTRTAREKFLAKLAEFRQLHNVPEANQTADAEAFFTTGLEEPEAAASSEVPSLAQWKTIHFSPEERADPAISGNSADVDSDGMDTLMEYALVSDPWSPDPGHLPRLVTISDTGSQYLGLQYRRRAGTSSLSFTIESSVDLFAWAAEKQTVQMSLEDNGDGSLTETIRLDTPIKDSTQRFLRLRVRSLN